MIEFCCMNAACEKTRFSISSSVNEVFFLYSDGRFPCFQCSVWDMQVLCRCSAGSEEFVTLCSRVVQFLSLWKFRESVS